MTGKPVRSAHVFLGFWRIFFFFIRYPDYMRESCFGRKSWKICIRLEENKKIRDGEMCGALGFLWHGILSWDKQTLMSQLQPQTSDINFREGIFKYRPGQGHSATRTHLVVPTLPVLSNEEAHSIVSDNQELPTRLFPALFCRFFYLVFFPCNYYYLGSSSLSIFWENWSSLWVFFFLVWFLVAMRKQCSPNLCERSSHKSN